MLGVTAGGLFVMLDWMTDIKLAGRGQCSAVWGGGKMLT
jgi:hypothetical protein